MKKLWFLFAALLFSPVAAATDCYHANGENRCMQLAGQFDTHVGPSLLDLMNQRAMQQQEMILRQQQIQMQQQRIQMQQQQMQQQQQESTSHKAELIKNSISKLFEYERVHAGKELDKLTSSQAEKFLEHLASVSEDERMQGLRFLANITDQQREQLIKILGQ